MHLIESGSIGGAWLELLRRTVALGCLGTDVSEGEILELLPVCISLDDPSQGDELLERLAGRESIDDMRLNYSSREPFADWGFSYGQRLFAYRGIDQIERATRRLRANPTSKGATITLLDPTFQSQHVPCVVALDFKIRNDKLMVQVFMRSVDVLRKFYADACCLSELARRMADSLGLSGVLLRIFVASAHVYLKDSCFVVELLGAPEVVGRIDGTEALERLRALTQP